MGTVIGGCINSRVCRTRNRDPNVELHASGHADERSSHWADGSKSLRPDDARWHVQYAACISFKVHYPKACLSVRERQIY
jgi:hypothetical protein